MDRQVREDALELVLLLLRGGLALPWADFLPLVITSAAESSDTAAQFDLVEWER